MKKEPIKIEQCNGQCCPASLMGFSFNEKSQGDAAPYSVSSGSATILGHVKPKAIFWKGERWNVKNNSHRGNGKLCVTVSEIVRLDITDCQTMFRPYRCKSTQGCKPIDPEPILDEFFDAAKVQEDKTPNTRALDRLSDDRGGMTDHVSIYGEFVRYLCEFSEGILLEEITGDWYEVESLHSVDSCQRLPYMRAFPWTSGSIC